MRKRMRKKCGALRGREELSGGEKKVQYVYGDPPPFFFFMVLVPS